MICSAGTSCPVCGRRIFVTGGTGTWGTAFIARCISAHQPDRLTIYSRDEMKHHVLRQRFAGHDWLRFRIGDVRDLVRLEDAIHGSEIVIHAAAMKIIAEGAIHPDEMLRTNCIGTMNVLRASVWAGADQVLVISSDKACQPANLYGATKLAAEHLASAWNAYGLPRGCASASVRYGNVCGSRGSAVEIFRHQRAAGEPITVTDPAMTRFWMTIDQAVDFVLRVLPIMRGGEVFIPRLPSVAIMDVARAIGGSDLDDSDWPIRLTGRTPGEKLHESLVSEDEVHRAVEVDGMIVLESPNPWPRPPWVGEPVTPYRSDSNPDQLSVADLQAMLGPVR